VPAADLTTQRRHPPADFSRQARHREAARLRQRRCRARQRAGVVPYVVEVPQATVVEALIASGRLSEGEALHRVSVEHALAAVLIDWAARWRKFVTL
jgi:hypothetical protein